MEQIVLLLLQGGDASRLDPAQQNALPLSRHGVGSVWLERYADALDEAGPPSVSCCSRPRWLQTTPAASCNELHNCF